jgi:hypothetical protein
MTAFLLTFNERNRKLTENGNNGPGYSIGIDFTQFAKDVFPEDCQVITDHDLNGNIQIIPWKKTILLKQEPEAVIHEKNWMIRNINLFHRVYTFDADLLKFFPEKTIKWVGNCGCNLREEYIYQLDPSKKEFKVSFWMSASGIRGCWGHLLRSDMFAFQEHFPSNCVFFRSVNVKDPRLANNPTFGENKNEIFETFQFAVTIENSRQVNYFTSKLTDCLVTKTIPIYWGCPNISEYYDTTGWIFFESAAELSVKIREIPPDYYSRYTDVIEKNYQTALGYCDFYSNLERQAMNK